MDRGRMNGRNRRHAASDNGGAAASPERNNRQRRRGSDNGSKKNWFLRHKVFSIIVASILLVGVASACVVAALASDKDILIDTGARNQTQEPDNGTPDSTDGNETDNPLTPDQTGIEPTVTDEQPPAYLFSKDIVNILVLGTDTGYGREGEAGRTDCIILVSINQKTAEVSMISIPRDTYVKIYNEKNKVVGENKINVAYRYGMLKSGGKKEVGIAYAVNTVGRFLSGNANGLIPIDQYVVFDMDLVIDLVRAVGGVTIDVKFELSRKDGDPVNVKPGLQKLNAYEALAYARKRHGVAGGDLSRGQHQQEVMMAVLKEVKKKGSVTMIPNLYDAFVKNCYTSVTADMVPRLAWIAKDVNIETIKNRTIKGKTLQISGGSYVIASQDINDPDSKQAIIKELYGIDVKVNSDETYSALYSSIQRKISAGQGLVDKANALLNNNKEYYSDSEAAALRSAIAEWNTAKKKNDIDEMADAQDDVQVQYDNLKALIDSRKSAETEAPTEAPTDVPETAPPTEDPPTSAPVTTTQPAASSAA